MIRQQEPIKFVYPFDELSAVIEAVIRHQVTTEVWLWMKEKSTATVAEYNIAFVSMPRKTGKAVVWLSEDEKNGLRKIRPGFSADGWTLDRLCRIWLLMQLDTTDPETYQKTIEDLFRSAAMQELVALYSALPVLAYPERWTARCAEGIRSNIGDVLEAIMCRNPYPAENLGEAAWNQLVLKAFFTDKPINQIIGLDSRANPELAQILSDYAHERWAAGRPVNPQLWRCVGRFIDEKNFPDIQRIAASENTIEREAAALACWDSSYPPAKALLEKNRDLKTAIASGEVNWNALAEKSLPITNNE